MLNRCEFIGRLAKDVDLRFTQGGAAVANFTVACGEKWKDKTSGEQKESVEFVKCVAWNQLGEICGKYLRKASLVYVAGKMETRKYEKDGITHYSTEIKLNEMKMLSSKSEGQGQGHQPPAASRHDGYQQPAQGQQPPPGGFDDDIPF